jgi:hypothetical protein
MYIDQYIWVLCIVPGVIHSIRAKPFTTGAIARHQLCENLNVTLQVCNCATNGVISLLEGSKIVGK